MHGNGFPFLCSMVLFAVTAERFACAITHPRTSLWARSGVAARLERPPRSHIVLPLGSDSSQAEAIFHMKLQDLWDK